MQRGHGTKQHLPAEWPVLEFLQPPASHSSRTGTCRKSLREQGKRRSGSRPCTVPVLLSLGAAQGSHSTAGSWGQALGTGW